MPRTHVHGNRNVTWSDDVIRITKLDAKYIAKSWETYTQTQIWPRNDEVNLKGVQTVLNLIAEEGALKKPMPRPEEIVDSKFLDEARKVLPR